MSASPPVAAAPSQKRPLEEPSSPSASSDEPDAKRPALDKVVKSNIPDEPKIELAKSPVVENGVKHDGSSESTTTPEDGLKAEQNGTVGQDEQAASDLQPIQSTIPSHDLSSQTPSRAHQDETGWLHLRAVITSAEAATVIGKGGENVTVIRKMSGAKCTVSEYSRGAVERILTVSGTVEDAAKVSMDSISRPESHLTSHRHSA
jgi:heterogeneous nuclear rnp K-like protein 2